MPKSSHHDEAAELTTTEARQGNDRRMNLRILVISTLAAALALGSLYLTFITWT